MFRTALIAPLLRAPLFPLPRARFASCLGAAHHRKKEVPRLRTSVRRGTRPHFTFEGRGGWEGEGEKGGKMRVSVWVRVGVRVRV